MAKPAKTLQLEFAVDSEPVNGYFLARCPALDLVSQGETANQARATLLEEARLVLAHAQSCGGLEALAERLAKPGTPGQPGETAE